MVGSIASTMEVRSIAISSDIIYLGCKGGIVEVWCRHKLDRKEVLQTGSNGKILCMSMNNDEEILVVGTSDGRIQVQNKFNPLFMSKLIKQVPNIINVES